MARPLVVVTDAPFPDFAAAEKILQELDADIRFVPEPSPETIARDATVAHAVMVTYARVTSEVIAALRHCQIIARMGIGLDNIDVEAATTADIVVTNVPDYCVDEVSDHALALLLSLVRRIPRADRLVHAGGWSVQEVGVLHRLRGQVLGLVGFGKIGRSFAHKAQAVGLRVVTYDPYLPRQVAEGSDVEQVGLHELLATADIVSIHAPLTPETHHLFGEETFRKMKPGALLINTSRGGLVDEHALAVALERGDLGGAALDVVESEPPAGSPFLRREDVILTPHTAYYSEESTAELQRKAAEDVVRVLQGETPCYQVNRTRRTGGVLS